MATFDFTKHKLDNLIDFDWSQCHIASESVTYNDVTFKVNSENPSIAKGSKSYFWFDKIHTCEEVKKT